MTSTCLLKLADTHLSMCKQNFVCAWLHRAALKCKTFTVIYMTVISTCEVNPLNKKGIHMILRTKIMTVQNQNTSFSLYCVCLHCMYWVQTCGETHDAEYPVQLVMMEGITGFDVFLATVKDRLGRQQLRKDAANCPNIWCMNTQKCTNTYKHIHRRHLVWVPLGYISSSA